MRLFLAIDVPGYQAAVLAALQKGLPEGRPVEDDTFHLTLAFLGDGTERMVEELDLALDGMRMALPPVVFTDFGVFGSAKPRAVWVGAGPPAPLDDLHRRLARRAREAGFTLPARRFVPHVTLARFREGAVSPEALARYIERKGPVKIDPFQPHAVTLYRSHLRPEGPLYEPLADYPVTPDPTI